MEEYIKIPWWPEDYAKKAYSDGYFIEAMQVVHGFIELELRELIFLQRKVPGAHEHFDLALDLMYELPLNVAVKVLFILKTLSKKERDELLHFNKVRNNIIHRIYYDSSKHGWIGFPKVEYDKAFQSGLDLMEVLQKRIYEFM